MMREHEVSEINTPSGIWIGGFLQAMETLGKSGGRSKQAKVQPSLDVNVK